MRVKCPFCPCRKVPVEGGRYSTHEYTANGERVECPMTGMMTTHPGEAKRLVEVLHHRGHTHGRYLKRYGDFATGIISYFEAQGHITDKQIESIRRCQCGWRGEASFGPQTWAPPPGLNTDPAAYNGTGAGWDDDSYEEFVGDF